MLQVFYFVFIVDDDANDFFHKTNYYDHAETIRVLARLSDK